MVLESIYLHRMSLNKIDRIIAFQLLIRHSLISWSSRKSALDFTGNSLASDLNEII